MNPDPITAWHVVVVLVVLVNLAVGVLALARSGQAQKRDVTLTDKFQTVDAAAGQVGAVVARVDRLEGSVEQIRADLRRDRSELDAANEARSSRLHARIDALTEKVNTMPDRVVAMLRNTGHLER